MPLFHIQIFWCSQKSKTYSGYKCWLIFFFLYMQIYIYLYIFVLKSVSRHKFLCKFVKRSIVQKNKIKAIICCQKKHLKDGSLINLLINGLKINKFSNTSIQEYYVREYYDYDLPTLIPQFILFMKFLFATELRYSVL